MRTFFNITIIQLLLSAISAMLMAQMSFFGKLGISIFYKEYSMLKSPLESGIVIFIAQLIVVIILHLLYIGIGRKAMRMACVVVFILASIGLVYTIYDFSEEFSHKILKTKFHVGAYLIWIGFMLSSIYYFFLPKRIRNGVSPLEDEPLS